MCIVFLYANGNPLPGSYKLIVASNRDEFYGRPTLPAAQWTDYPHAFGGVDVQRGHEGGTWLAISGKDKVIKVGVLLNVTGEGRTKDALGRGSLVTDYVTGNKCNETYINELMSNQCVYNPNNLITLEIRDKKTTIIHCSNAPCEKHYWPENTPLGFSNSPYKTPFQKVIYGQEIFGNIINEHQNDKSELVKCCMNLLKDSKKCWPDSELETRAPTWGEDLSSVCVKILKAGYGSRTRSVILVDWENKMDYFEETMMSEDPNGEWKMTHIQHQF